MSGSAVFVESYNEINKSNYIGFLKHLGDGIKFSDDKWICTSLKRYPAEPPGKVTIHFGRIQETYREITKYFVLMRLISGKTVASAISYICDLKRFFMFLCDRKGGMYIAQCDTFVSAEFIHYLDEKGYANATKHGVWSTVNLFFSIMDGWEKQRFKNPFGINPFDAEKKYDDKYIPEHIAQKLDQVFEHEELPQYIRCAYWLLRLIPSRISEIIGMKLDCLKRYNGSYVLFIPSWKQNGGRKEPLMRSIHLEDTGMAGYLIELIKAQQKAAERIHPFLSEEKKAMLFSYQHQGIRNDKVLMFQVYSVASRLAILKALKRICKRYHILDDSGVIYNLTTHQFRHNGITDRLAAGFTAEQIADMTGHHGNAMIYNAYTHLNLLPETIVKKQEYVSREPGSRESKYVLFGGRILNMEEQLENRLLKNIRAHRVRGGICSDITGCKSDMLGCLECDYFVADMEQMTYYENQVTSWREKADRFSQFSLIQSNAERNAQLYEALIQRLKGGGLNG